MKKLLILLLLSTSYALDINIGYVSNFWFLQPLIIKSKGWDTEIGINFNLKKFISPAHQLQAFLGSEIDGMNNNGASFIASNSNKIEFKIISKLVNGDIGLISYHNFNGNLIDYIKKYNQTNNKLFTIVTNAKGSLSHLILELYLYNNFPDYLKYIKLIHAGDQVQLQQIYLSKKVDAISSFEPFTRIILKKDPTSKLVMKPEDLFVKQAGGYFGLKSNIIKNNPNLVDKLKDLYKKANTFIVNNPEETFNIIKDKIILNSLSDSESIQLIKDYGKYISNELEKTELNEIEKFQFKKKYIKEIANIEKTFYVKK